MVAWPPKNNSNNSRAKVASQGDIGRYLTVPGGYGRHIRLNASGLEKNLDFNEGDTVTATWAAFWIVEIWVHEDKKNEPIRPGAKGTYLYYNEYGWGSYFSEYDINVGQIVPSGQELYGPRPGFEPGASGGGGKNPYANVGPATTATSIYTNPVSIYKVPTLSSPGSSSFGVAVGGYIGLVTNIDAYGVTVTASLGKTSSETIQNIKTALRAALLKKGHSNEDIKNLLASYAYKAPAGNAANSNPPVTGGDRGKRGGGGGGGKNSYVYIPYGTVEKPSVQSIVTVRLGRSYETPRTLSPLPGGNEDTYPQMIQYLANQPVRSAEDLNRGIPRNIDTKATSNFSSLKFVFPYIPSDVQYSSLSSVWTEIPRGYNYPLLDWSAFQRMKVSFSLIIASTRKEPGGAIVPDGITTSVDEQLNILRMMFQTKQPITIYNMDSLLTNTNDALVKKPTQFVMTDLTIEGIRRQETPPQHVTTAQVNITLLEIIVEEARILNIEPPSFDEIVPKRTTTTNVPTGPDLWSPTFQKSIEDTIVLPTGTP